MTLAPENAPHAGNGRIQVDLHVHTCYSADALTSVEEVIATVLRRTLGGIAVTDHNSIAGALELQRVAPFPVIVGEEVMTSEGEIVGLFLQESVQPGLTPEQTIARIREQGGIVYVPHPFDAYRDSTLCEKALMDVIDDVDALEVLNARVTLPAHNERARSLAQTRHLLSCGGSDAHTPFEIGQAYVEMLPFADKDAFQRSLATGRVGGGLSLPHVHLFSTWAKLQKRGGA
jgi:predicted metal-dependent phosphoesterase TrpH